MAERDEFGAFIVGFLVGGFTGAVAALLLAPQSGEETRTMIKERAIELKEKAADTIDEAYSQAEAAAAEARARFEELAEMTKKRAEELQHHGKVVLEEQKAKLGEALQSKPKAAEAPKPDQGKAAA